MSIERVKQRLARKMRTGDQKNVTLSSEELREVVESIEEAYDAGGPDPQTAVNTGAIAANALDIAAIPRIRSFDTAVTNAEILNMGSGVPIQLLSAPGESYMVLDVFMTVTAFAVNYSGTYNLIVSKVDQVSGLYEINSTFARSINFFNGAAGEVKRMPRYEDLSAGFVAEGLEPSNDILLSASAAVGGGDASNRYTFTVVYMLLP